MTVHVLPDKEGWRVKSAAAKEAYKKTETQEQAIKVARKVAKSKKTDTKIHGVDGKIRAGDSYGNDPFPPRDKT